jgi:hypothetical protein
MTLDSSIDQALRSPEPAQNLRLLAKELYSRGVLSTSVLAMFEEARQALREAGREADEDAVMDVMDYLVGWCSPHMKLEPGTAAEIQGNGHNAAPEESRPTRQVLPTEGG